ncbi:MAG TPA: heme biosynthesis HemY N-terminal domain-containing protein [Steroidobacteraceae bacterium]|nr:heme biosynthesis HemY N-terminal domain-containing protein [Steroidobacteraceae bacterium]
MKRGLYLAIALIAGALLASLLLHDPGRVAINTQGYLIDMSLPVAVLLIIGVIMLVRLIMRVVNIGKRNVAERAARLRQRSQDELNRGLIELSAGNWMQAEQILTRSAFGATAPLVHYLAAARAAELQGALSRRDEWLAKALDVAPTERAAIHVTQAEMLLRHNQTNAALATLEQLDASGHQNARGLMLLARIYRQMGNWQQLKAMESRLRNAAGIQPEAVDDVMAQVHLDMLKAAGTAKDAAQLAQTWREVPGSMSRRPDVVVAYARAAMACGAHDLAERELRELLKTSWDESAILAYGEVEIAEPLSLLQHLEKWLNDRPQDPVLLYTCARCCIRNELYGKARSYLEASLGIRPRLETYQMLAQLLDLTGERQQAYQLLNDALAHAVGRKPNPLRIRALRTVERRQGSRDRRLQ